MGEESTRLENEIRVERVSLANSIHALESKLSRASNWRYQFAKRPGVGVAIAFAGGVALAKAITGARRDGRRADDEEERGVDGSGGSTTRAARPGVIAGLVSALTPALVQGAKIYVQDIVSRSNSNSKPRQASHEPEWRAGRATPDT